MCLYVTVHDACSDASLLSGTSRPKGLLFCCSKETLVPGRWTRRRPAKETSNSKRRHSNLALLILLLLLRPLLPLLLRLLLLTCQIQVSRRCGRAPQMPAAARAHLQQNKHSSSSSSRETRAKRHTETHCIQRAAPIIHEQRAHTAAAKGRETEGRRRSSREQQQEQQRAAAAAAAAKRASAGTLPV